MISVSHCAFDLVLLIVAIVGWKKAIDATRESEQQEASWAATADALKDELRARAGFTLIELLIVVSIMVILLGLVATMIKPDTEGRRVRETARQVNAYLCSARNRAVETKRPCGVTFRHFGNTAAAMTADQSEVPPPYAGECMESVARVIVPSPGVVIARLTATNAPDTPETIPAGMVHSGDMVQFNHQGPLYRIVSDPSDGTASELTLTIDAPTLVPWRSEWYTDEPDPLNPGHTVRVWVQPVAYRIFRSPVKGYAQPLQLPMPAVVDLGASGVGSIFAGAADFSVMFSSTGAVDSVYVGGVRSVPGDMVYLLIGSNERTGLPYIDGNPNADTLTNYQNMDNRWVTINPQTGAIQTEPVAAIPAGSSEGEAIIAARSLARGARAWVGGKKITPGQLSADRGDATRNYAAFVLRFGRDDFAFGFRGFVVQIAIAAAISFSDSLTSASAKSGVNRDGSVASKLVWICP